MPHIPMYDLLPELAEKETRTITVQENKLGIPPCEYGLVEMYCNDKNCDCRKVLLNVITPHNMKTVAMIDYGWEELEYYKKWMQGGTNRELEEVDLYLVEEMKGPSLSPMGPQDESAVDIFGLIKNVTLKDEAYVDRIKEHYKLFREKVDEMYTSRAVSKKIGRNSPCPCGSGKKHKRCCMGRSEVLNEEKSNTSSNTGIPDLSEDDVRKVLEETNIEKDFVLMMQDAFQQMSLDFRMSALKKKEHIKEYQKARKLHGEIVNSMMEYYYSGKFEQKVEGGIATSEEEMVQNVATDRYKFLGSSFDLEDSVGFKAFQDMLTYKPAKNMNSLTEEYISKNRYRREDKREFLKSMLDSRLGLFQMADIDKGEGHVLLEDIFTGEKIQIIDIALSSGQKIDNQYIYTRLITYNGFSFGTGLSFVFKKTDPFIKKFIEQEKKDYRKNDEFRRFILLYNQYIQSEDSVPTRANVFGQAKNRVKKSRLV